MDSLVDRITIYSQTADPNDDPEGGNIIAFGTFDADRMMQCWIVASQTGELLSCDSLSIDALGKKYITRKNLTSFDVRHENPEKLSLMLDALQQGGDYIEINPMYFHLFSATTPNNEE